MIFHPSPRAHLRSKPPTHSTTHQPSAIPSTVTRQRASWVSRDFSSTVNFSLYSLRPNAIGSSASSGRPRLVLRTLAETKLDELVSNEHGRSELALAAKRVGNTLHVVHLEKVSRYTHVKI